VRGTEAEGGLATGGVKAQEEGCKETLSPAMDILVSSNFERLMFFLAKGMSFGCPSILRMG
jgi:threonine synthase